MTKTLKSSGRVNKIRLRERAISPVERPSRPKVVGYLRVSTEGQFSDGHGLDVQERAIRAFAVSQGYELVDVVTDCVSGAFPPAERPGFARLVKMASRGEFSILLLYRFDRLARHVLHAVTTVHMLRDRFNIVVRSVTEPIDTATPMGEMIFTVLASMAAQERQVITERTWGGRREKAMKGGFAGGSAPFGYTRNKEGGLQVVETEAAAVKRMFEMRRGGATLQTIANELNAAKVPCKRGGTWRAGRVAYILDNPKYDGAVEYLFRSGSDVTHVLRDGDHPSIN